MHKFPVKDSMVEQNLPKDDVLVNRLLGLVEAKKAKVGVVGLGYVGLPLTYASNRAGFSVLGFDVDAERVRSINSGTSPIKSLGSDVVKTMLETGRFEATSDFDRFRECDLILICVPTPLGVHREPDLSFIEKTGEAIAPRLRVGQLIVLESTTYPGTTSEVLQPILETSGLAAGAEFLLAYSPEREDPGNVDFKTHDIPRVVGGHTQGALTVAAAFYGSIVPRVIKVASMDTAEAVKLTENIFRSVNIALVNELKLVYGKMGINIWDVINAAKSKPFGFMAFYPGPGLGGHCIPIDPFYLTWKAREFNTSTKFIELAGEVNSEAPLRVIDALAGALSDRKSKGLKGARILLLGVAYKKNVDDMRESPSLRIIEWLEERGAVVDYYDPFFPIIPSTREHAGLSGRKGVVWEPEQFGSYDACLICTDHDGIDYQQLVNAVDIVVDARNATVAVEKGRDRIVLA